LDEEETDEDEGSDYKGSATKTPAIEIEGMQMLTREQIKNKSIEDEAQLAKNMNNATAKLNL
jgi:hypothetical protein